uniref:Sodefrin-like factor n=1 Tax=Ichthyosaura alpestris TaxID=54263 RepID=A0A172B232_ICHAP|nr:sodefrin precursor-like factor [Ichthyosaura alpestris]
MRDITLTALHCGASVCAWHEAPRVLQYRQKDCLLCEKCLATGSSQCSGIFKQCPPDVTHCFKGLENATIGDNVILTAFKDCLDPSQKAACGRDTTLKNSFSTLIISRTCCDSDSCNGGDVRVPALNETLNGYKCKDCFTAQSVDTCTAAGEVQCTGEHYTCGSFSGTAARPGEDAKQYFAKGCASEDFCQSFYLAGT